MRLLDGHVYLDLSEGAPDLRVRLRIGEDSLTLATDDETLGTWVHPGWSAEQVAPDRFRMSLGEETFVFAPDNLLEFKYEVMPELAAPESAIASHTRSRGRFGLALSRQGKVAAALAVVAVVLAVMGRPVLAVVSSAVGALLLLVAVFAQLDPHVAAKFPDRWSPNRVLLIGLMMLIGGGLLSWLS